MNQNGLRVPESDKFGVVTAYADDVTIFTTYDDGFNIVNRVYDMFSRASAAYLHYQKSQGLWAGSWVTRNYKPLNFNWNNQALTFFGVHLGNKNKDLQIFLKICREKLHKALSRWKGLSKCISYKGKVLIASQPAASKLFHYLAVLSPPEHILNELQQKPIDFVWSGGSHWLDKQMFQFPEKGGLGLACLQARMLTYRFTLIQKLLKENTHPSFIFISHHLRRYRNLNLDSQLFHIDLESKFLSHLPTFHSEIIRAWITSRARIVTPPDSVCSVLNLPLHSTFTNQFRDEHVLSPRLLACGMRLVGDIIDPNTTQWKRAEHLNREHLGPHPHQQGYSRKNYKINKNSS